VRRHPCYNLSGAGRYGPLASCIAPKSDSLSQGMFAPHTEGQRREMQSAATCPPM